ncbi:uncharacterized protein LOC130760015 [Actinidia eriantha]|uniref:uncharacterized protein LOC130760015 n=1 Tax=Actinidia eriantha TaxID=165200 RepID=UPI00258DB24A|nr:uncharacterized protein LOC130760015 [Actinidia eriantha]
MRVVVIVEGGGCCISRWRDDGGGSGGGSSGSGNSGGVRMMVEGGDGDMVFVVGKVGLGCKVAGLLVGLQTVQGWVGLHGAGAGAGLGWAASATGGGAAGLLAGLWRSKGCCWCLRGWTDCSGGVGTQLLHWTAQRLAYGTA